MRWLAAAVLLGGCGLLDDEPNGPPPPVGESQGVASAAVGTAAAGSTGADPTDETAGSANDESTGPAPLDLGTGILLVGDLLPGDASWALPMDCTLRFFLPEQLDTQTGVASDWQADVPITIESFPQPYSLGISDFTGAITIGSEGYVGVRCDLDGDGRLDSVGAFYPSLPPELVTLPAEGIDMGIVFL